MQCFFDYAFKLFTGSFVVADETFDQLALTIENKCLRNRITVGKQEAYEILGVQPGADAQKKAAALAGMANAARIANGAPLQPAPAKVE